MNTSKINSFFERLGRVQIRYRIPILIFFILLTIALGSGLSRFKIVGNSDSWYGDSDQIKIDKKHYQEKFGNTDGIAVLVLADDVFKPEVLGTIYDISRRMETECPFAKRVRSLTSIEIPRGNEEGFEIVRPFENGIPDNLAEIQANKDLIMSRKSLVNTLVSADAKETYIYVSLNPYDPAVSRDDQADSVGYFLIDLLDDPAYKSDSYKILGVGLPYTELIEANYEDIDQAIRVGIGLILMLILLALFTRSAAGTFIPALTTICAIASSLGLLAWCGIVADETLFPIPVILGMALSVGYSIHYINMFRHAFASTGKRKESALAAVTGSGWPILFTVVTTVASLMSFFFVNVKPIIWLGKSASLIVLSVYAYTSVLVPIFLSFGKDKKAEEKAEKGITLLDRYFEGFAGRMYKRRKAIIVLTVILFAAMIPGIAKIHINIDIIGMCGTKPPFVQKIHQVMRANLGSIHNYQVMIEYDEPGTFKNPDMMAKIIEMEKKIGKLKLTKKSDGKARVTSVTSVIKEFYRAFNEDSQDYYIVPEDEAVLAQIMEFCSIDLHKDFAEYMDEDFMIAVFNVEMTKFDTKNGSGDIAQVRRDMAELFPDAHCSIIGDMVEYNEMGVRIAAGEVKSLLMSVLIIGVLLILAFMSISSGLIGMIPNIAPIVVVGGVMGYLDLPLDLATMTVCSIILGIAVDDTIHLNTHVKVMLDECGSYQEAMRLSFREIGKSMFQTTVILCAMFFVFAISPLKFLSVLGFLLSLGLAVALIADYTVTPALIYIAKPFGKERFNETSEK